MVQEVVEWISLKHRFGKWKQRRFARHGVYSDFEIVVSGPWDCRARGETSSLFTTRIVKKGD